MKVHSIVRIHFATGLILMKLNRPMSKKEKGQNLANFKIMMLFSYGTRNIALFLKTFFPQ